MKPDLFQAPDYYNIDDLLSEEHLLVRDAARQWVKRDISPIIEEYAQKAEFPNQIIDGVKYAVLANNIDNPYTLTIQEGYYTPEEMANELQNGMNNAVTNFLTMDPSAGSMTTTTYDNFKVHYDRVGQQIYIGNNHDNFKLVRNFQLCLAGGSGSPKACECHNSQ